MGASGISSTNSNLLMLLAQAMKQVAQNPDLLKGLATGGHGDEVHDTGTTPTTGTTTGATSTPTSTPASNITQSDSFSGSAKLKASFELDLNGASKSSENCGCHCSKPSQSDSCQPEGGLKSDGKTVTTPGGYKIESNAKHELTITGPDGKSSKIWGDPHVQGSDGNKFDFKKPSSFVLDDGTRIDVNTTKPSGKDGVTYASDVQVTNGNDRVKIDGLDQGPGKVGQVTQDGKAHAHDFDGNDVFKEAGNASHWAKDGKEVEAGGKNGEYKLGKDVDTSKVDQKLGGLDNTLAKGGLDKAADDGNPFASKPYGDTKSLQNAMSQIKEMLEMFSLLSKLFGGQATA